MDPEGVEPSTSSMSMKRSTDELRVQKPILSQLDSNSKRDTLFSIEKTEKNMNLFEIILYGTAIVLTAIAVTVHTSNMN